MSPRISGSGGHLLRAEASGHNATASNVLGQRQTSLRTGSDRLRHTPVTVTDLLELPADPVAVSRYVWGPAQENGTESLPEPPW